MITTLPTTLALVVTLEDARQALRNRYHNVPADECSPLVEAIKRQLVGTFAHDNALLHADDGEPHIYECVEPRGQLLYDYWTNKRWPNVTQIFSYGPITFNLRLREF